MPTLRAWRALFWLAALVGVALALWPHTGPPDPWFPGVDKLQHALAFALLARLGQRAGYRSLPHLAIGLLALGAAIEAMQALTATRSAEWLDWFADALGVAAGLSRWPANVSGRLEQEHGR